MPVFVDLLEKVFVCNYPQYKGTGTSNGANFQSIFSKLADCIYNEATSYNIKVEKSVGIGRWSAVPWIRVFYPDISPSAQDGIYIVYLFSASGKSVFVTLNQGTTDSSIEKRRKTKSAIQNEINSRQFKKNEGTLSIGDNKNYGEAAIFYKEYHSENLPSDEELLHGLEKNHQLVLTLEDGILEGGFGQKIASFYGPDKMLVKNYGLKKQFYDRYNPSELLQECGMTTGQIVEDIKALLK